MMTSLGKIMALAATASLVAAAAPPRAGGLAGTWINAKRSVTVRIASCGAGMCGPVIAASDAAREKAAAGGTARLIGTELFHDFRRQGDGLWYGQVYVPDLDQTVDGTIAQQGPNTLVGSGCLVAGFGCKQQVWTRVGK